MALRVSRDSPLSSSPTVFLPSMCFIQEIRVELVSIGCRGLWRESERSGEKRVRERSHCPFLLVVVGPRGRRMHHTSPLQLMWRWTHICVRTWQWYSIMRRSSTVVTFLVIITFFVEFVVFKLPLAVSDQCLQIFTAGEAGLVHRVRFSDVIFFEPQRHLSASAPTVYTHFSNRYGLSEKRPVHPTLLLVVVVHHRGTLLVGLAQLDSQRLYFGLGTQLDNPMLRIIRVLNLQRMEEIAKVNQA